jgi:rhodanese-related sulfurtransferase
MPSKKASRKTTRRRRPAWLWGLAALAAIVLITVAALLLTRPPAPAAVQEIGVMEAYNRYQAQAFFLDVREQSEWDERHIPNATLIPLGQLESRLGELPADKDQAIVIYCRSGNRSQDGWQILHAAGYKNITSLAGGINQWQSAGYPVIADQ